MITGNLLFATHGDLEHLGLIERAVCTGHSGFPRSMISKSGELGRKYFDDQGRVRVNELGRDGRRHVSGMMQSLDGFEGMDRWVLGFLKGSLEIDPERRITAAMGLGILS